MTLCKQIFCWAVFFTWGSLAMPGQTTPADSTAKLQPGIVVEQVSQNTMGEKAGIKEGDVILHWSRGSMSGDIVSPFGLDQIEMDQEPQGTVTLDGRREGERQTWVMGAANWMVKARPQLAGSLLSIYREARELEKANKASAAARMHAAAMQASSDPRPWLASWFLLQEAKLWTEKEKKQWNEADAAYAEAIHRLEQSEPVIQARLLRAWAASYQQRSDWANAEKYYHEAILACQKITAESLMIAGSLNDLGNVAWYQGDLEQAQKYFRQDLEIIQKLAPGSLDAAATIGNLGNIAAGRGDLAQAEQYYRQALEIDQKLAPGGLAVATMFGALGIVAFDRGDLAEAERYFQQDLEIGQKLAPGKLGVTLSFNNLGNLAFERGDLAQAEKYYQQALKTAQNLDPGSLQVAGVFSNLGVVADKRGDLAQAEKYEWQSLTITQKVAPGGPDVAISFTNLGNLADQRGDLTEAEKYFQQALEIYQKLAPNCLDEASSFQGLGDVAGTRNDLAKAEEFYRHALDIREKLASGSTAHAESLAALASVLRRKQQLDEAALLYGKALEALESQTARLGGSDETRAGFRADHIQYYREYVDLLIAQKRPELAFAVLERSRARSLLELLAMAHVDIRQGVDAGLVARAKLLQAEIAAKNDLRSRLLSEGDTGPRIAGTAEEIHKLVEQYNDVQGQIRSSSPGYAALTQPHLLNAQAVQEQLLDSDTVLLEYSLGKESSYVFVVTPASLAVYLLPKQDEIESTAQRVYALLTAYAKSKKGETPQQYDQRITAAEKEYRRVISRLSKMILGPAAAQIAGKRLLIVSDGALQYIPFAALSEPDYSGQFRPLVLSHEIVNLPSASILAELRRTETKRGEAPRAVAVLADPVFDKSDPRVQGNRRQGEDSNGVARGADEDAPGYRALQLTRAIEDIGAPSLERLLYTRKEAAAIQLAAHAGETLMALDFDASRAAALSPQLAKYRVVHFATHGLVDNKHPELSGLVLSLVNKKGVPQDGFLGLQDIYNLNLPAELVVLSACETGLGKNIRGEGLVGLTRGFMYAGASRVMASLWKVNDVGTAKLMAEFYREMEQQGKTPAAALRGAQIDLSKEQPWNLPYYWAAFQIQGEWR